MDYPLCGSAKRSLLARWRSRRLYCAARSSDDSINEKSKGGRHDGSCARSRVRSRATLHNGRRHRVIGAELSHAAGPNDRAVRRRRTDRRDRAHRRAEIVGGRSEEHTSELQSLTNLVCRLLLEKKKKKKK